MSSEEAKHMPKPANKDDQSTKNPLESDDNTLFQTEELLRNVELFFLVQKLDLILFFQPIIF